MTLSADELDAIRREQSELTPPYGWMLQPGRNVFARKNVDLLLAEVDHLRTGLRLAKEWLRYEGNHIYGMEPPRDSALMTPMEAFRAWLAENEKGGAT